MYVFAVRAWKAEGHDQVSRAGRSGDEEGHFHAQIVQLLECRPHLLHPLRTQANGPEVKARLVQDGVNLDILFFIGAHDIPEHLLFTEVGRMPLERGAIVGELEGPEKAIDHSLRVSRWSQDRYG